MWLSPGSWAEQDLSHAKDWVLPSAPLNFSGLVPTEGWSRLVASEDPYAEVWIAVGPGSIQPGCLPKSSCETLPLALKGSRGPGSSWAESVVCSLLLRRQLATSLSFLADFPGWSAWESDRGWDRGGEGSGAKSRF